MSKLIKVINEASKRFNNQPLYRTGIKTRNELETLATARNKNPYSKAYRYCSLCGACHSITADGRMLTYVGSYGTPCSNSSALTASSTDVFISFEADYSRTMNFEYFLNSTYDIADR
jgi:hypothetical protein